MKKLLAPLLTLFITAALFTGCDKADMKIKKLNHGDGTWTITSIHYETYDSLGRTVISDSTQTEPGEFLFFKSTTLDGLFDYHFAVITLKLPNGASQEYPCGVYFDDVRADVEDNVYPEYVPAPYNGLWTVTKGSRRKQEWSRYSLRSDGTLDTKVTMLLKFK